MRRIALGLLLGLGACALAPVEEPAVAAESVPLLTGDEPNRDTAWILHPAELDESQYGTSNCTAHLAEDPLTFAFGPNRECGIELQHDDWGCFERETGHDGWRRQQIHRVHCNMVPACNMGPGDVYGIRLCREPETDLPPGSWPQQPSPCNGNAGPNGCAGCFGNRVVCH